FPCMTGSSSASRTSHVDDPPAGGDRGRHERRLDHIFLRGLASPDRGAAGTLLDSRGSSDHLPVWAVATLDD
ncbi:MAG TPA: hypothetical protein VGR09_05755, partial [Gemmatimonadales bacterium]|nr:hypothetical protein [Gemmatimonadales bacterium]